MAMVQQGPNVRKAQDRVASENAFLKINAVAALQVVTVVVAAASETMAAVRLMENTAIVIKVVAEPADVIVVNATKAAVAKVAIVTASKMADIIAIR